MKYMKSIQELYQILFAGKEKYSIGLLFIFANLANYFINMRKLKLDDNYNVIILLIIMLLARAIA